MIINRIQQNLCAFNAPHTTPLYTYWDTSWRQIDATILTKHLCLTVTTLGSSWGIQPTDISIHSLHSSGAMALICTRVDMDIIHLLG